MKKVLAILIVSLFSLCSLCFAGTKQLNISWEKEVLETDLAGFQIEYTLDNPEVDERNWNALTEILFTQGQTSPFTHEMTFDSPNGENICYWFRARAIDTSANPSDWLYGSTEVSDASICIDFEGPGSLMQLKVTISGQINLIIESQ